LPVDAARRESIDESHPLIPPHRHHPIASLSLSSIIILLLLFAEFYINSCFLLRHFTVFYLFFLSCKEKRKEKSKKLFSFYFILVFGSANIFQ
jgi:hypothetical protein